jgi:hypothetical protein
MCNDDDTLSSVLQIMPCVLAGLLSLPSTAAAALSMTPTHLLSALGTVYSVLGHVHT